MFGVGDDDQTIYGYNGADPGWLIDFSSLFPLAGDHPLEVNYRCPGEIVRAADNLLRHNRRRVAKTIRSGRPADVRDELEPPGYVRRSVRGHRRRHPRSGPGRHRRRHPAVGGRRPQPGQRPPRPGPGRPRRRRHPHQRGVGAEFADRTAIRAASSWLRLAVAASTSARFDPDAVSEALRRPSRSLHPRIGDWATEQQDLESMSAGRPAERGARHRAARRVRPTSNGWDGWSPVTRRPATCSTPSSTTSGSVGPCPPSTNSAAA
ncbi:MAG: hypothetical protein R2715_12330 [Ilumatobacteraceae bacterium]